MDVRNVRKYTASYHKHLSFSSTLTHYSQFYSQFKGHRDREHMVVGFTTTYAIGVYHHYSCEFESCSWRGVLHATVCIKVCQWLTTGWWFSPGSPFSSTNKTDRHEFITEILLKVALSTINQPTVSLIKWQISWTCLAAVAGLQLFHNMKLFGVINSNHRG
jgi:hypothetical protein